MGVCACACVRARIHMHAVVCVGMLCIHNWDDRTQSGVPMLSSLCDCENLHLMVKLFSCCRSLSVSSVSSVSSASSSSSSVRSADSDDMYADLASPVSSASSSSPTQNHPRKERGAARDRPPHGKDKNRG